MKLTWVTAASYMDGYRLALTFNDGSCKVFDFSLLLATKPTRFGALAQPEVFKNFALDGWTVTWDNGKIDIAPEYLLEHGVEV